MISVATLYNLTLICALYTQDCVLQLDETPLTTLPFTQLGITVEPPPLDVGPMYNSWPVQQLVQLLQGTRFDPTPMHCCTCQNNPGCCPAGCAELPRQGQIACCMACAFGGCNLSDCLECT